MARAQAQFLAFMDCFHVIGMELLNGSEGKLSSSMWATLEKYSQDTALRNIEDLIKKGVLMKDSAGWT